MGLISRVSSRTYRLEKMSDIGNFFKNDKKGKVGNVKKKYRVIDSDSDDENMPPESKSNKPIQNIITNKPKIQQKTKISTIDYFAKFKPKKFTVVESLSQINADKPKTKNKPTTTESNLDKSKTPQDPKPIKK